MTPRTRLDKVVQVRERKEDGALSALAEARAATELAAGRLSRAREVAKADRRAKGPVELWQVDELARRRALQGVKAAEQDLLRAKEGELAARDGYVEARKAREVVGRIQERRRAEIVADLEKRDQRGTDEVATRTFNASR
ncbi:MAG TPA: hypothetical protein VMG32_00960 [Anaeromyxobacteraceae bacterium]|nr:hypothetical protein [Anaeromyxobacteraceae bacterium]